MAANVRSLARVFPDMDDERSTLGEFFTAMMATVGLFTSVNSHVCVAVTLGSKTFTAILTCERFVTRVCFVVSL